MIEELTRRVRDASAEYRQLMRHSEFIDFYYEHNPQLLGEREFIMREMRQNGMEYAEAAQAIIDAVIKNPIPKCTISKIRGPY